MIMLSFHDSMLYDSLIKTQYRGLLCAIERYVYMYIDSEGYQVVILRNIL